MFLISIKEVNRILERINLNFIQKVIIGIIYSLLFLCISCAIPIKESNQTKNSPFTHGNVQLNIKKGVTDQAEILEKFGPPNVATTDSSGNEIWTYQKHATVTKSSESGGYGTIILFGTSSSTSGFEQSSKTMTLIIKFDTNKKVLEFKSMSTSF